jgi:hypothetical protein
LCPVSASDTNIWFTWLPLNYRFEALLAGVATIGCRVNSALSIGGPGPPAREEIGIKFGGYFDDWN